MHQLLDGMYHASDFRFAMLLGLEGPQLESVVSSTALNNFKTVPGERTYSATAFSQPGDTAPRNITAWLNDYVSIGTQKARTIIHRQLSILP